MGIREANTERVLQSGSTYPQRIKSDMISKILRDFHLSPSYVEVTFNDCHIKVGVQIIDDASSTNQTNHNSKYIIMKPNEELKVGDIINYAGYKWLCVACEMFNDIYYKGKIIKSSHSITVYKNSQVYNIPIIVENSVQLYRMNQDDTKYFVELSDNIVIRMQNNEVTSLIDIDEIYKIGQYRYKITNKSDIIEPNILIFKLEISKSNPSPIPTPEPSQPINIIGESSIIKNQQKEYTTDYDGEGELTFSLEGTAASIVSQDGVSGSCVLKAGASVGIVILTVTDGEISGEKEIRVKSILGGGGA